MATPEHSLRAARTLGVDFAEPSLLECALTHPSLAAEMGGHDYERLEFLGDSVLGLVVAQHVYDAFPELPEGDLTRMKVSVVRGGALARAARTLGVGELVLLGRGADAAGERDRDSVLENAMEAIIGAIFVDAGFDAARAFVERVLAERLSADGLLDEVDDPKTRLQEAAQARGLGLPSYRVTGQEGPPHERVFDLEVLVDGEVLGTGRGSSKRAAAQEAAAAALQRLAGR
jgi:ribonuclease-3